MNVDLMTYAYNDWTMKVENGCSYEAARLSVFSDYELENDEEMFLLIQFYKYIEKVESYEVY